MAVTVRRNFAPLTQTVLITREDWQAIGVLARERIVRRTASGLDAAGQAFTPYSEGYAEARVNAGLDASTVRLQASGEMLRGIQVIPHDTKVEVTF